jgi:hypothetical protein
MFWLSIALCDKATKITETIFWYFMDDSFSRGNVDKTLQNILFLIIYPVIESTMKSMLKLYVYLMNNMFK